MYVQGKRHSGWMKFDVP